MYTLKDIQLIIVLYNQSLFACETFKSISESAKNVFPQQKIYLFVYDNSFTKQTIPLKHDIFEIVYFHDPSNAGLGVAYNKGANYAKNNYRNWILLLDQDTKFLKNALSEYLIAINKYSNIFIFSPVLKVQNGDILSPISRNRKNKNIFKNTNSGVFYLNQFCPINSGLCIKVDSFFVAGGYNEKIKLDRSDFQFIERFSKIYDTLFIIPVLAYQNFSNFDTDIDKLLFRYKIFLADLKNYETDKLSIKLGNHIRAFRRGIALVRKTKSLKFIKLFLTVYMKFG